MPHPMLMSAADTGMLVIDTQEKLVPSIHGRGQIVLNIEFLLNVAKLIQLPIVATEQYRKGLGGTVEPLAGMLPAPHDKVDFSCCAVPTVTETFHREARPKLLLVGIETHVCVSQTALDLLAEGFRVFIAVDAVGSRYANDHDTALRRLEQAGAVLTTAEAAAFEWLGRAGTPEFKALSKLVQDRMKSLAL